MASPAHVIDVAGACPAEDIDASTRRRSTDMQLLVPPHGARKSARTAAIAWRASVARPCRGIAFGAVRVAVAVPPFSSLRTLVRLITSPMVSRDIGFS